MTSWDNRPPSPRTNWYRSALQDDEGFRLLVEGVKDYAIFMLDPDGNIISWNAGAERIKGHTAEEIIGKHFSVFYPSEVAARGWPEEELRIATIEGRYEDEGWRIRKDGSRFWADVVITAIYDKENRLRGFAKVTRDLSERRRLHSLETADRRRNEFLAMLAHELRNPLAPIRNAISVMASGVDANTIGWSIEVIERQLGHLTRLVDDLLDVSRVTSGRIILQREPVEIATVVARAVESTRPLIEARGHHVEIVVPERPLIVEGDLVRLTQVVLNLVNNSAKYTPEGGRIELRIEEEEQIVVIRVRDSGIGIAPDLLPNIFDLFTQGDRSLDRSEGGLGLGLTLVRRLVAMHGGSVEARSDGPGQGSEFTVRLPLRSGQPSPAETSPTPESKPAVRGVPHRVLVVDDNVDSAETIAVLLHLWGHDVRIAHDGPTALSSAAEYRPHVVLLDIGLPGMSGYEVARRLRAEPGLQNLRLMAMTGYAREDDSRRAFEEGFDNHLVKPVDADKLQQLIDSV